MIKAIETLYSGCRFRSRLEARWAKFFDALGIKWEYEKEGYDLGEAGWYLPDFWLSDEKIWVEIKGQEPTGKERDKAEGLFHATDNPVIVLSGTPGGHLLECFLNETTDSSGGYVWHRGEFHFYSYGKSPGLWIGINRGRRETTVFYDGNFNGDVRFFDSTHDFIIMTPDDTCKYYDAVNIARSARFEHK